MRTVLKVFKWVAGIGLLLVLVIGVPAAFLVPKVKAQLDSQRERARGTLVLVEPAAMGQLVRTVSAPGTIAAKTSSNITSRVSAKINAIHFEEGQTVKEGDVLIELDSLELLASLEGTKARYAADLASLKSMEANLAAEEARIVGAKAAYENSLTEFERQQELYSSGDVSKQSLDNARTEVDRTRSAYEAAKKNLDAVKANVEAARARADASRAEVERAQRNVDYCTIRAPFDGLIVRRIANVGETALGTNFNAGNNLMILEDVSETLVKVRLAETDAPRVAAGQKVRVYVNGYGDRVFEGVLRRVGMTTQRWVDGTYYFESEVLLNTNGERLSSGTTANVDIEIETIEGVLVVPSQAVLDKRVDALPQKIREGSPLVDRDKTFARIVMLMKEGKVEYVPVRTIASSITKTAIAEGIEGGAPVIVGPYSALQTLADGAKVRVEEEKKKASDRNGKANAEVAEKDGKESAKPASKAASAG